MNVRKALENLLDSLKTGDPDEIAFYRGQAEEALLDDLAADECLHNYSEEEAYERALQHRCASDRRTVKTIPTCEICGEPV